MSFLLLGLPLLLGSCAAAVSNGSADDVRVGMTEAQVRHLLGAPLARTVTPDSARWHYQWGADWHNRRRRLELSFRDGRVVNFLLNEELAVRPYAAGGSGALSSQVDDDDFLDLLLSVRAANRHQSSRRARPCFDEPASERPARACFAPTVQLRQRPFEGAFAYCSLFGGK